MGNGFSLSIWLFSIITGRVLGLRDCSWLHQCDQITGTTKLASTTTSVHFQHWHVPETNVRITMRAMSVAPVAELTRANVTHVLKELFVGLLEDKGLAGVVFFED